MSRVAVVFLQVMALLIFSACATPTTSAPEPSEDIGDVRLIDIATTDSLRFEPEAVTVAPGESVRFVITNRGSVEHEFFIGDESAQEGHARSMAGDGHSDDGVVAIGSRETVAYDWTAPPEPTELLIGCHLDGHYLAGMKATLSVRP